MAFWSDGDKLTPTDMNITHGIRAVKTADEVVNNSVVLQDDDDLEFAVGANERWAFMIVLDKDVLAASDFKYGFSTPAGTTGGHWTIERRNNIGSTVTDIGATAIILTAWADVGWGMLIHGSIETANAGTVTFQWAQNAAVAEDTKVNEHSYLIAWRLDQG